MIYLVHYITRLKVKKKTVSDEKYTVQDDEVLEVYNTCMDIDPFSTILKENK